MSNSSPAASTAIDIAKNMIQLSLNDERQDPPLSSSARLREVELFLRASELESQGQVSQAIKFYGQAFRLNPDVDYLVNTQEGNVSSAPEKEDFAVVVSKPKFVITIPGLLEEIEASVEEEEYEPFGLAPEIMTRILSWVSILHTASLEECAKSCKKLYIYSRSSSIWKRLCYRCQASLVRKSINTTSSCPTYRHLYFDSTHLRTDGVYICKLSYFRPGVTDGHYYQPVHMVTYYRYLRFFPSEGGHTVILLVTTEEPKQVIQLLRNFPNERSLSDFIPFGLRATDLITSLNGSKRIAPMAKLSEFKKSNLFIGKYFRQNPSDLKFYLTLYDPQSTHGSLFEMEVNLVPKRKSNVIVCDRYVSVSPPVISGKPCSIYDFDTKQWNKFIFSRVRSYHNKEV